MNGLNIARDTVGTVRHEAATPPNAAASGQQDPIMMLAQLFLGASRGA